MDFERLFGAPPTVVERAPGRVNLIGEHTDYNGGYVLPTVIPADDRGGARAARRPAVRVWSANVPEPAAGDVRARRRNAGAARGPTTCRAITWVLGAPATRCGGFDARVTSGVPLGSGLSSSAALEISLMRAISDRLRPRARGCAAGACWRGARRTSSSGRRSASWTRWRAASPANATRSSSTRARSRSSGSRCRAGVELAVINSGVAHNHAKGDYRTRRAECEDASRLLGVPQLRDVVLADLPRVMALPDPLGRRARHVVTEDDRVLAAVRAMRAGDIGDARPAVPESHDSMRDDYEVSVPEVDVLVEEARRRAGRLRRPPHRRRLRRRDRRAGPGRVGAARGRAASRRTTGSAARRATILVPV